MTRDSSTPPDRPSERVVEQRVRNRVIEYLSLAGSFEEQQEYERTVPIAHIPYEVINQWEDNFPQGPERGIVDLTVYSTDEVNAVMAFHAVWQSVSRAIPDDYPTLASVQAMPAWDQLRQAALAAGSVFAQRGTMSEDHEEP